MSTGRAPLCLCILDGFGEREEASANAVRLAAAPNLASMARDYPRTLLSASGPDVGLPKGQMGNSEVGHLNFGAGRVAQMDLSRIDVAAADGTLAKNPVLRAVYERMLGEKIRVPNSAEDPFTHVPARLHLMGLVSDGGIHSSLEHLLALIDGLSIDGVPLVVHAFLDGRDAPPRSAMKYLHRLEEHLARRGVIGTVAGRYWAMDRDKHWDRVRKAFDAIVVGGAEHAATAYEAIEHAYASDITDEFVPPTRIGDYAGVAGGPAAEYGAGDKPTWEWRADEAAICFNFRPDRMRELCAMLLRKNLPFEVERELRVHHVPIRAFDAHSLVSLTEYDPKLEMSVAFPKENVTEPFGEVISRAGKKQFRCAETEKYAHVTYFFNGGREEPFPGEERKVVPSPRDVATYDKKPEMSADAVTDEVVAAIESGEHDFVLVNFANPDMVGHTGVLDAATRAVEVVDRDLGRIRDAVLAKGGTLLVTADHGNCETMVDAEGQPHTAHTVNPVPFYWVSEAAKGRSLASGGRLADVAPTMLELLDLEAPAVMTGKSLIVPRG